MFGSFTNTATTTSTIRVAILYLQQQREFSPMEAAGTLVSFSLLVVAGSTTASWLIGAIGWRRSLGLGLTVVASGNAMMATWPSVAGIATAAGLCGLGIGIGSVAATDMGTHLMESFKATAAGLINSAAQLGTAIGTASILLVSTISSPRHAWITAAVCATLVAVTTSLRHPERRPVR
ncbi:MFS transporter [Nesterenkonia populi]|uniref:MFS transporter n=1 Tax=Nesterenkonia populi TaxID=1591087 RepID=UPI0011BD6A39|nr:MFS transporter [Nesterenkonia populi]